MKSEDESPYVIISILKGRRQAREEEEEVLEGY